MLTRVVGVRSMAGVDQSPAPPVIDYVADSFHTLVLQPTTLCNLDCAYCYLPYRRRQTLMSVEVAGACAESIRLQASRRPVDVIWHAGEPTATPLAHFRALLAPFEDVRHAGAVRHGIQTNATLVDTRWCELFAEYQFQVGVSIDGPMATNLHRVDWRGGPTWQRTMRGIRALRDHQIRFTAICVVSPQTIDRADMLVEFFGALGCESVGFNIEEQERASRAPVSPADAYRFWQHLWRLRAAGNTPPVRDLDRFAEYVVHARASALPARRLEPLPTVGYDGTTVLLSPELLGVPDADYGDFEAGNVLHSSIPAMIGAMHELRYVRELATALRSCANDCALFDFCGGAQAGNRYFEHGSFAVAETNYCRTTKQALVRAAADQLARGEAA